MEAFGGTSCKARETAFVYCFATSTGGLGMGLPQRALEGVIKGIAERWSGS